MEIMEQAHETVLINVTAPADIIRRRMTENPHERGVLKEQHVESTLERFDHHFSHSLLRNKMTLDTSETTVEETMRQFVEMIEPHLSDSDRLRIQTRSILRGAG